MKEQEILNHEQVNQKIRRIAFQITEVFLTDKKVILAGIDTRGYEFAKKIKLQLQQISEIEFVLCKVVIDKKNPRNPITTSLKPAEYQDQGIVLCDDVLNSGTTLIYGVKHFLEVPVKKFKTAVLVNRSHKKYPVKADFKGISLSTNLEEHIEVSLETNNYSVTLS